MPRFERYIGVDYSGAGGPDQGLAGIRVYTVDGDHGCRQVRPMPDKPRRHWSRKALAEWLNDQLTEAVCLVGLDYSFSFPLSYMERYGLTRWEQFLDDFCAHWPTRQASVERCRQGNARSGSSDEYRLCERWTASAKSTFQFDMQGSVAKSAHAGIPWLAWLRQEMGQRLHIWPYEGLEPPAATSMVAECYPSLFRRRYDRDGRTVDEQDAMAIARWLQRVDRNGSLETYLHPPLEPLEQQLLALEGWILGVW